MMGNLLHVKGISKGFGGVQAVHCVEFAVKPGELVALIGPNGAGKSTVLNMISGVIPPSSGEIYLENQSLSDKMGYQYASLGIARTFQNLQIFEEMTVLENVMIGFHSRTKAGLFACGLTTGRARKEEKNMIEQSHWLLEKVGIGELAERTAGSLPYGKLRLLEIARAMAIEPKLLLLDETAAGLNHTETAELSRLLKQIQSEGTAILLVEHDMDMVMTIADRIVVLDQGEKIAEGTPEEIQRNERVIAAYLGQEATTIGR